MADAWVHEMKDFMKKHGLTDSSQVSEKKRELRAQEEAMKIKEELEKKGYISNTRSTKFELVTGVNPGYGHSNTERNPLALVGQIWQEIAEREFEKSGIYVSANLSSSKTVYSVNWGCPVAGEDTVSIIGTMNPQFVKDTLVWKEAVLRTAKELKEKLEQSTIVLTFQEVDEFIYLT